MESLVEELTCPVCLELYEQPVLLPCAHSLCKRCAQHVFAEALRRILPKQKVPIAMKWPQVQCPSCRHDFPIPDRGMDGFRRNTTLQNIVDRYREAKTNTAASKSVPCQMCDLEPPAEAVKTCLDCNNSYCEACLVTFHPMRGGLARHTLTEPSAAAPKVLMCTEHVQEKVNMYCETDGCLICSLCKLVGKHKDHEVAALSDTFQLKKDSIGGRVAGLIQQNAEVECFVDNIQKTMTQTQKNCAGIKTSVDAFADRLAFAIAKRKSELHTKVEEERNQKLGTLGQQLDQWADTGTGITAAIAEAETLLNEEDPITFLQGSTVVEHRLAAFAHLNERKLKTTDQFTNSTVAVSDLEQKISSLDFLRAPEAPKILTDKCTAGGGNITVSWAPGGNTPVDKYRVWYRETSKKDWQGSIVSTNTSVNLPGLERNTGYSAVVVAVNATGNATSRHVNIKTKHGALQFALRGASASMVITNGGMSVTCSRGARSAYNGRYNQGYNQGHKQPGVRGNVTIDKGRHYWEVNVEGSSDFGLGVTYGAGDPFSGSYGSSMSMKQPCMMTAHLSRVDHDGNRIYDRACVGGMNTTDRSGWNSSNQPISRHWTKVGVVFDYDGGSISYYDQNHTLITSQTQQFHNYKACPYFVVNDPGGTLTLVQDCVWPEALQ